MKSKKRVVDPYKKPKHAGKKRGMIDDERAKELDSEWPTRMDSYLDVLDIHLDSGHVGGL